TAHAMARAKLQALAGGAGPFIVCSSGLLDANNSFFTGGILSSISPPVINTMAVLNLTATAVPPAPTAPVFLVHGNAVGNTDVGSNHGDCGWKGSPHDNGNFDGLENQNGVTCATVPCFLQYTHGNVAGPTRVNVAGLPGCAGTDPSTFDNCYLVLPIMMPEGSTPNPCQPLTQPDDSMCIVTFGLFKMVLP